jgi:hypothetical protein
MRATKQVSQEICHATSDLKTSYSHPLPHRGLSTSQEFQPGDLAFSHSGPMGDTNYIKVIARKGKIIGNLEMILGY